MKTLSNHCIFLLGLYLVSVPVAAEQFLLAPGSLQIEDGDTLLIEMEGARQRVQLSGIDAPEDTDNPKLQHDLTRTGLERQRLLALGRMSTEYLQGLTQDGTPYTLHYEPGWLDRYGRLNGDLQDSGGRSLAEQLVAAGYAIAARDANERMRTLQAQAQGSRKGLWGLEPEAAGLWAGVAHP